MSEQTQRFKRLSKAIDDYLDQQQEITLTLTREQAKDIQLCLDAVLDYDHFTELEKLKKQIEEKLK